MRSLCTLCFTRIPGDSYYRRITSRLLRPLFYAWRLIYRALFIASVVEFHFNFVSSVLILKTAMLFFCCFFSAFFCNSMRQRGRLCLTEVWRQFCVAPLVSFVFLIKMLNLWKKHLPLMSWFTLFWQNVTQLLEALLLECHWVFLGINLHSSVTLRLSDILFNYLCDHPRVLSSQLLGSGV